MISVMNGLSSSILDKCMGKREEEQETDSTLSDSEVEEENKPTGDMDDSSSVPLRRADVVAEEVPPPPPGGQCIQNTEETNPLGPPGPVVGERGTRGRACEGRERHA